VLYGCALCVSLCCFHVVLPFACFGAAIPPVTLRLARGEIDGRTMGMEARWDEKTSGISAGMSWFNRNRKQKNGDYRAGVSFREYKTQG